MATVQELAQWVVESFDPTRSVTVERSCEEALRHHGIALFAAQIEAGEKAQKVLVRLRSMNAEDLPFEISERNDGRLIGKKRARAGDTPETLAARQSFSLVPEMLQSLYSAGNCTFEKLCAALIMLSGAKEASAGCTNDDGGIDVYGRIPLRLTDDRVKAGILNTVILQKDLLLLGQCKCYEPTSHIEPGDLRAFLGAINDCLNQYEGSERPPSHRVPKAYYRRGETCIAVFFTTASFTDKASEVAQSNDIILVDGKKIAQFLIHHGVAVIARDDGTIEVDAAALAPWAEAQLALLPTSNSS